MTEISQDDRRDVCAALVTMASISSSYKVENTQAIAELTKDVRNNIPVKDNADYIAVILSLGRIVDLGADQINVADLQMVISSFREKLDNLGTTQGTATDLGAAYLTMSCVSHSHEVETTTTIVSFWDEIRKNVTIKDQADLASAVLATGRIMDIRIEVKVPEVLADIVENIRKEMKSEKNVQVDFKDLSILLLAAAFVELSPKVEKYRDIIKTWLDLKSMLTVSNIKDIVSIILFSGKIRDLDTSLMIQPSSLTEQIGFIRTALDKL